MAAKFSDCFIDTTELGDEYTQIPTQAYINLLRANLDLYRQRAQLTKSKLERDNHHLTLEIRDMYLQNHDLKTQVADLEDANEKWQKENVDLFNQITKLKSIKDIEIIS